MYLVQTVINPYILYCRYIKKPSKLKPDSAQTAYLCIFMSEVLSEFNTCKISCSNILTSHTYAQNEGSWPSLCVVINI